MARLPEMRLDDEVSARIRARRGGSLRPLVVALEISSAAARA